MSTPNQGRRLPPVFVWVTLLTASVLNTGAGCDVDAETTDGSTYDPAEDPRVDDFGIGLVKGGQAVRIALIDAIPAMVVRDNNAWTLRVTDLSGTPLEDFTVEVRPWMPDHGHGTGTSAEITHLGDGEVRFDPLRFHMQGLWEVTFTITESHGGTEDFVIGVWVP